MNELGTIAEVLAKYGAWSVVALLLLVVRALYARVNTIQDARLSDMKDLYREGVRSQEAAAAALDKLEEVVRALKP